MGFPNTQDGLQEALKARDHHPDQQVRIEANDWLQEFIREFEAWQISNRLLHDAKSNLETLIFCSQTLKTKIQRDFEELPHDSVLSLRDSLQSLLEKFSKGPSEVRMEICIAMSALAVHVSAKGWVGGGILNWLGVELGSNPDYLIGFLELLRVLPLGASSSIIAAHQERRCQFQKELVSSAAVSFDFLASCLSFKELHEQVLYAFASWLRLSLEIPTATCASHSLVSAAISGLNSEQLFDAAVNAICKLIRYTVVRSPGGLAGQMQLVQVLVSKIMELWSSFSASLKDDKIVKGMDCLFEHMGYFYVELIAYGTDLSMRIVDALMKVISHPEYDISPMTSKFWHNLQNILTDRKFYRSFGNEAAINFEMKRRLTIFRPTFELLVSRVSFRVLCPQSHEDSLEKDNFNHARSDARDILTDAASVLGRETTLEILSNSFFQEASTAGNGGGSWDWRYEDALEFCISAIQRAVPRSEGTVMSPLEEARKLWKRKKEEVTRKREMERRQKQRVDEIREYQKKVEETMHLKDQLRGEVSAELEQIVSQCKDMASFLRLLGITVEEGALPLSKQVDAAIKKALRHFHPDRASNRGLREQVKAEETFKLINLKKTSWY